MLVYVVVEGYYSDYHIEGIFTTRERAEEFVDFRKRTCMHSYKLNKNYGIEEWELDSLQNYKWIVYGRYNFSKNVIDWVESTDDQNLPFEKWNTGKYVGSGHIYDFAIPWDKRFEDKEVLKKAIQDRYAMWKAEDAQIE